MKRFTLSQLAIACSAALAINSHAATLEEVIVTAQKRVETLQDVAVSVNVVGGDKLVEAGITKLEDLQAYVPNLTMSETGIGTNIYMRGIGSGINQGFEQSVGMYVDGVYYGRAQLSRAPFLDLSRVEVLRGPQNILYGRNSIAGAMSIITAPAENEFQGRVSATYEPVQGEQIFDLMLTGPISDTLSYRVAHRSRNTDGFIENIDGGDEPERDEDTTRISFNWDATDDFNAKLKYEQSTFDITGRQIEIVNDMPSLNPAFLGANWSQLLVGNFGAGVTPPSALNTTLDGKRSSNGDFSDNETHNVTLNLSYLWNDYEITSTTARVDYEYKELCDCDFTSANIFFVESGEEYEQFSQELRITSPGEETIDWIAGLYYQDSELNFNDRFFSDNQSLIDDILNTVLPIALGSAYPAGAANVLRDFSVPRDFDQETELLSGFVQVTWNINDSNRLTLGGRQSQEKRSASRVLEMADINGNILPYNESFVPGTEMGVDYLLGRVLNVARHNLSGDREESNFAPAVSFETDLNDDVMAYANWSRGFKAGGYDVRSNSTPNPVPVVSPITPAANFTVPAGSFEFKQEQAETIEFGLKTRLAGGAAELNIAAFRTDFEDLQVSIYDGVLGFNVGNAAKATSQGIEIDGRYALTESFTLSGAVSWLDFEFDDYENGQCTQLQRIQTGQSSCSYDGLTNQYVADFSGVVTLDYETDIGDSLVFNTTLDAVFTTEFNPSQNLDPLIEQDGYTKLNLRIGVADYDGTWEVALITKNLTDEDIITYANDTPLSSNLAQSVGHYAFVEPGTTYALQATYNF